MPARWSEIIDAKDLHALAMAAAVEMVGPDDDDVLLGIFRDVPPAALGAFAETVLVVLWQHRAYGPGALRLRGLHLARRCCGLEP